jgi:pyruvate,water dikinase
MRKAVAATERAELEALAGRRCLGPRDGALELAPLIGGKAANLASAALILGHERLPGWFAITTQSFREALEAPLDPSGASPEHPATLGEAIASVLARRDVDVRRKSAAIQDLWLAAALPSSLCAEIVAEYRALGGDEDGKDERHDGSVEGPYVAIRSSALEEDAEESTWAGQFDTYLFVRGERSLLRHVRLAWAGLWSERALHQRERLGTIERLGSGGLVVQRMVRSRVSGVLLTVYAATGELREMAINVGLGLGEGVVSGTVEVDQVLVSKEGDLMKDPLKLRYSVGDKREQVVLDDSTGVGTRRQETLYHQRLRPALEYVELCELVRAAKLLEDAYRQPLDIEFAYEDALLRILQVRPVTVFHQALAETLASSPSASGCPVARQEKHP